MRRLNWYTDFMENMETNENKEMKEVLQKLNDYLAKGFLLHGSKNKIEVLEPRQAKEDDGRETGSLNAVYAADDIRIPIFMALFDKKAEDQKGWRAFYSAQGTAMRVGGENVTFTTGYVHILPHEKFTKIEDERSKEIVSFESVTPEDVIEVNPNILKLFSDITYEIDGVKYTNYESLPD
jgi:hypothetical protein